MSTDIGFGICIPNFRRGSGPETMLAATQAAERLGWHCALATDHILVDSAARGSDYRHIHEALMSIAWLAGQTTTIRLGTSVLVVPMRSAMVLAKELATVDTLSDGRLIAGVGIGWNETEFQSVGAGDRFHQRGAFLEETIELWRYLWGGGEGPYRGRFDGFEEGFFGPLPPQGAELPIWIGATAEAALRRAGRIADGYHCTGGDPASLRERANVVGASADEAGRDRPLISARVKVDYSGMASGPAVISGSPEAMAARVREYADAGARYLVIDFGETDPDLAASAIERFDQEVVASLS